MCKYNVVMEMKNSTVVAEYEPEKKRSDAYQSEAALEKEFIRFDVIEIYIQNKKAIIRKQQLMQCVL